MPFTAEELVNIGNATIDHHRRTKPVSQVLQDRPLYNDLMANKKPFGGAKDLVTGPVKGAYTSRYVGYSHDDDVNYANPANIRRWQYAWYELAAGISYTATELKKNGIHVVDTTDGASVTTASDAELYQLVNIFEDKMDDLMEGSRRSLAEIMVRDGTQDAKAPPGVLALLPTTNNSGLTGGIDRAANSWWRHRVTLNTDVSTPGNLNLTNLLQKEIRQLRRYGNPKHRGYAGSDFLDGLEKEIRSKGNFTLDGWWKQGRIDIGMADVSLKGIEFVYEPLLDDLSLAKHCVMVDLNAIRWMPMSGEEEKAHTPARPPEKFVFYRALTTTGMLAAEQLNTSGRYSIA